MAAAHWMLETCIWGRCWAELVWPTGCSCASVAACQQRGWRGSTPGSPARRRRLHCTGSFEKSAAPPSLSVDKLNVAPAGKGQVFAGSSPGFINRTQKSRFGR